MPDIHDKRALGPPGHRLLKAAPVIVVGSVMFTFISYWRVAAVVLCDMASTAFYIGGIVEQLIGPAAPWFILAVMLFSYAVRSVYIESCSMFVRGGVYRVVKEALGSLPAKAAVSALLFDYILTGPISSVSAGQYLVGLALDILALVSPGHAIHNEATRSTIRNMGSVVIACLVTLYFFRKNIIGIHESSDKALRIMWFTSVMAVVVLIWSGVTLAMRGPTKPPGLDRYDQRLMTAIIEAGEKIGKPVKPLIVPTNDPLFAIANTAKSLRVQELIVGASNKLTAETLLEKLASYWKEPHGGQAAPLTIRVLGRKFDVHYDIGGGSRIPKAGERHESSSSDPRSVERPAGKAAARVLMTHDGTHFSSDVGDSLLTIVDPHVHLSLVPVPNPNPVPNPSKGGQSAPTPGTTLKPDQERWQKAGHDIDVYEIAADTGPEIIRLLRDNEYGALVLLLPPRGKDHLGPPVEQWVAHVRDHSPCLVIEVNLPQSD